MTAASRLSDSSSERDLTVLFECQKKAYRNNSMPGAKERIRDLDKLHNAIIDYKDALLCAVNKDFSHRSEAETLLAEVYAVLEGIAYYRKNLRQWMKPEKRHVPLALFPARAEVVYQPLGVIGIVVPWNFPIFLCLSPLIGALAAGNSVIIKTSEFAPATSTVIKQLLGSVFEQEKVAVVEGDVEVSMAFTRLPFDHLVFTGATPVGKLVMEAAAKNLTPVTLELGGKSPALIHPDYPIHEAAGRIAFGKCINAGQICVSPDYVLCPESRVDEFVEAFSRKVTKNYPSIRDNDDYTAIINERQLSRLKGYLEDARSKGATLKEINPACESLTDTRKLPVTLILDATQDMKVLQEEIFGPLLVVIPYGELSKAIHYINSKPRPLALYYFDYDKSRANLILKLTHSGGVCINDTLSHVTADDIPFGGVGASGMGHYHGKEGFLNFSKAKGVVRKGYIDLSGRVGPPWDKTTFKMYMKIQNWRFRKRKL